MLNIILIAPPAAGKGTQSELLSAKYNIPHISTGRLIREKNDEKINKLLTTGELLDDVFVLGLLEQRLLNDDCKKGFILDGFPRNLKQASMYEELLNKLNIPLGIVVYFNLDSEVAMKRAIGRLECNKCGAIYNDEFMDSTPKVKGVCDNCKQRLYRRIDDTKETFMKRYDEYLNETFPLIKHFEEKGILYTVDCSINKETTFNQIESVIKSFNE